MENITAAHRATYEAVGRDVDAEYARARAAIAKMRAPKAPKPASKPRVRAYVEDAGPNRWLVIPGRTDDDLTTMVTISGPGTGA